MLLPRLARRAALACALVLASGPACASSGPLAPQPSLALARPRLAALPLIRGPDLWSSRMTTLDRGRFFAAVRACGVCGPTLSQTEVDGLTGLLDAWDRYAPGADLRHVAYTLATAWHEARLDAGVREIGRGAGKAYGRPAGPYGLVYYGRGPCQLTWLDNYEAFGKRLGLDLVQYPDRALEPEIGAAVLVIGARNGLFRKGRTLARFFSATTDDPVGARDVINGDVTKNGALIAGYHKLFLAALRAASAPASDVPAVAAKPAPTSAVLVTPASTRPPNVSSAPPSIDTSAAAPTGFWSRVHAALSRAPRSA